MEWSKEQQAAFAAAYEDMKNREDAIQELVKEFNENGVIFVVYRCAQYDWASLIAHIYSKNRRDKNIHDRYSKIPASYILLGDEVTIPFKYTGMYDPKKEEHRKQAEELYLLTLPFSEEQVQQVAELASLIAETHELKAQGSQYSQKGDSTAFFTIKPRFPKWGLEFRRFQRPK